MLIQFLMQDKKASDSFRITHPLHLDLKKELSLKTTTSQERRLETDCEKARFLGKCSPSVKRAAVCSTEIHAGRDASLCFSFRLIKHMLNPPLPPHHPLVAPLKKKKKLWLHFLHTRVIRHLKVGFRTFN